MGMEQHVIRRLNNRLQVKEEAIKKVTNTTEIKKDAIYIAKKIIQGHKKELMIHGNDGRTRNKKPYGDDPIPLLGFFSFY